VLDPIVAFVAELVTSVLVDGPLDIDGPTQVTQLELEVRRSSEGDVFWRVLDAEVVIGPFGPLVGMCGVIERYDP
jgi:hypothetical protein